MLREPRGYPAANCNLILPSTHPEADAGYVIMEQVEYPGMSGTNTMCVVTVLLETGMLPMREPVTELTLEAPAGLIRVTADVPRRQGHGRHVPQRAGVRDAPRRAGRGARSSARSTVDVAYGGMFYVIADAERFGLRLTPDEGADIVRITEMIKAAASEQLPVVHPGPARASPGITIGQLSGPAARPGEQPSERRHGLDRDARLGATRDLDRRHRPLAVRHRARPPRWRRSTPRASSRVGDAFRHEGILGTVFTGRLVEETHDRGVPGGRPDDHGPGLDHRVRQLRRRPDRSVPRRLHGRRHLGVDVATSQQPNSAMRARSVYGPGPTSPSSLMIANLRSRSLSSVK